MESACVFAVSVDGASLENVRITAPCASRNSSVIAERGVARR
jgi:hypothetical protein